MELKGFLTFASFLFFQFSCASQTNWSIEDLHVTTFRNGDPLLEVTTESNWKYCNANQIPAYYRLGESLDDGVLYNFYAVKDERQLAPVGYRIPELDDVKALPSDQFFQSSSGGWKTSTGNGFFNAESNGYLPFEGETMELFSKGDAAYYWTITDGKALHSMGFVIVDGEKGYSIQEMRRENFCAVRCVMKSGEEADFQQAESALMQQDKYRYRIRKIELSEEINNTTRDLNELKRRAAELETEICTKELKLYQLQKELQSIEGAQDRSSSVENHFQTVKIGNQVWMTENLNVDHFRNGDPIPELKTKEDWEKAGREGTPAWCYYNNDEPNCRNFGKLYNWFVVTDPRGLSPVGYRIPNKNDWDELFYAMGGIDVAAINMKSTTGWKNNGNGSSDSSFSGIPGGARGNEGFQNIGEVGAWWSSSDAVTDAVNYAYAIWLRCDNSNSVIGITDKSAGFSVRCLKY